jgi:hypothetical protein
MLRDISGLRNASFSEASLAFRFVLLWALLDALARQVGVRGMFPDWPAATTFYASCTGMK